LSKSSKVEQGKTNRGSSPAPDSASLRRAALLDTEEFLSYDDFWRQQSATGGAIKKVERRKTPQEIAAAEAEALLSSAREEAAKVMQDAYDQGFAEGEAAGLAKAKGEYQERIAKLGSLLSALDGQRADVLRQHEEHLLELIKTMVDRLVNHEVSVNPLVIKACLQKAMDYVVENSTVQVHLHADDFNRIKKISLDDPSLLAGKNRVQLVEDPQIGVGGCFLKTDFGEIDATLEQSRARLFAVVEKAFSAALAANNG